LILQKLWSTANFKYCSLIMRKADDERARIHIHPQLSDCCTWNGRFEHWLQTFHCQTFQALKPVWVVSTPHTLFPRQCETRFSFSNNSSRSHCEIMLSNLNQLRPGVADFKSSSWQHHMTNSSQWCS
jgi:hypothetical protein